MSTDPNKSNEGTQETLQRLARDVAAAKARGKKFGRPAKPLPENFHQVYQDWRNGKMVLREAADACGMPSATFYDKAMAYERVSGG